MDIILVLERGYMGVREAHALNETELNKYDSIYSLNFFSVAENKIETKEEIMKSFNHNHDEYEFIIPLTTIPLLFYANADYIGEVGFCYPVNPYVQHGLELNLNSKVISITISREYVEAKKATLGFANQYFYTRFFYNRALIELIRTYQNLFLSDDIDKKFKLINVASKITTYLIKNGLKTGEDNRRPEKQFNMRKVVLYIEENYLDPELTIEKCAEYSGYSMRYFSKAFKLYMADTPIMHLNKRRISEARRILQNEDVPLGEVAKRCGYKNFSTFSQAFNRVMGMTPTEYRNKYLNL